MIEFSDLLLPSHESYPPFRQPAQMKICGICSMYPAFRYIPSHNVLLITGTETSCKTLGNGPSFEMKQKQQKLTNIEKYYHQLQIERTKIATVIL